MKKSVAANKKIILIAIMFAIIACAVCIICLTANLKALSPIAHAESLPQTYELKIKLHGTYYWVKGDSCDGVNCPNECGMLSTTPTSLTVGSPFDIEGFKEHIANGPGFVEGKYIDKFVFEGTDVESFFASNVVLQLPGTSPFIIEPKYADEIYIISFSDRTDILSVKMGYDLGIELPTKTGYTFLGWSAESQILLNGDKIPDMSPNKAVPVAVYSLIDQWSANTYQVTFVLGQNNIKTVSVVFDQPFNDYPSPEITPGYKFNGYRYENSEKYYLADTVWDIPSDVTLYPNFTPITYKITYDGNGGTLNGNITSYDVTQLPLKLTYTAEREFDYFDSLTLNGATLTDDTLPANTVGNITVKAMWKADRRTASSSFNDTEETFSSEITVVDCKNISLTAIRTMTITSTVKEITFIGNYSDYVVSKQIKIEERNDLLTINLYNINWGSFFNTTLLDAIECPNLILNCIGTNKLHGGLILGGEDSGLDKYIPASVITCQHLVIAGDNLTVTGSPLATASADTIGGCAIFCSALPYATALEITIDELHVQGGTGGMGVEGYLDGTDGGYGIFTLGTVKIDGHDGQVVYILGGDGGDPYDDTAKQGNIGTDILATKIVGRYFGNNGLVDKS